jgi:VWFA-related protein
MHCSTRAPARSLLLSLMLLFTALCVVTRGQEQQKARTPTEAADEIIRVNTELIQTDVMVFDKNGRFVDGLGREQFELRVDGQPVPVTFFERIRDGSLQSGGPAERGAGQAEAPKTVGAAEVRGRTIIFFIDDFHLSLDSLGRTRQALTHFLDDEMTPWDRVAFVSASGQIGFLQQFTDHKAVLRAAMARLKQIPYNVSDTDTPPMPDYVAIRIQNGDRDAADLYIDKILEGFASKKGGPRGFNRNAVFEIVKTRANNIVYALEAVTGNSLASLENLVRSTGQVPGRKLVFYLSDGFYLNAKNGISSANTKLQRVIDAATRTGSTIYTIDARGLFALLPDANGERPFDPQGRLDRAVVGEAVLSQDGLNALAGDTGGRFLKNQNYFDRWVARMLNETSSYYVLAWHPETEAQKAGKFKRVEVGVAGRPELTVRMQRGYFEGGVRPTATAAKPSAPDENSSAKTQPSSTTENDQRAVPTAAAAVKRMLPTLLTISFVDVPGSGPVLTSSVQVATDTLNYGEDGKQAGFIDLGGVVLNDQGKQAADFKTRLSVTPLASSSVSDNRRGVIYNHRLPLMPGLYQIRVAARDGRGGQTGSASQWIEIPDLAKHQLALSSLLLGGTLVGDAGKEKPEQLPQVQFSVDRRFAHTSRLSFLLFIYNAVQPKAGVAATSGLTTQVQVLSSDGRVVVDTQSRPLPTKGVEDTARIPYAGSFPLQALRPGHYLLRVSINDATNKSSATEQAAFTVE